MALRDYIAGEIAHDHADGLLTRREALRRLGLIGIGLTSASALLAACGSDMGDDNDDAAATTTTAAATTASSVTGAAPATGSSTIKAETISFTAPSGDAKAAFAKPASDAKGAVLVIHENRGLTPHFYDVVGRLADAGYGAMAVDLLSPEGGTAAVGESGAQAGLANAPRQRLLADLQAGIGELGRRVPDKKIGTVGFCFGGGMVWNLLNAGETRLAAAVPFYGPAPEAPDFTKAKAAVLAIYGEQDANVNATRDRAVAALEAAKLTHEVRTFAGAGHAFFNDTGARYNAEAAKEAYAALLDWFGKHLT